MKGREQVRKTGSLLLCVVPKTPQKGTSAYSLILYIRYIIHQTSLLNPPYPNYQSVFTQPTSETRKKPYSIHLIASKNKKQTFFSFAVLYYDTTSNFYSLFLKYLSPLAQ